MTFKIASNKARSSQSRVDPSFAVGTEVYGQEHLQTADAPRPNAPIRGAAIARKRVLFVANVAWFFKSHRLALALGAIERGYEVHLASSFVTRDDREEFERLGILTHEMPFERSGTSIVVEMRLVQQLHRLLASLRPDLIHNVSIKPVIYGGLLGRWHRIPSVNAISGLGYSYIAKGLRASLRRSALNLAYSLAVSGARSRVIVQNEDDYAFFCNDLKVSREKLTLIKGSGVDLKLFDPTARPSHPPIVVLPARMLIDKGVREFSDAARMLKQRGCKARFVLVGSLDPDNRTSLTQSEIDRLVQEGAAEYWGHRSDIPKVLADATIVCLPSYREGFPKSLLEAAAAGRVIVTTDVPGCREIVEHGANGFLVPAKDATALAQAIEVLLNDADLCARMGARGRNQVETKFSLDIVVNQTMTLYGELLR